MWRKALMKLGYVVASGKTGRGMNCQCPDFAALAAGSVGHGDSVG